MLSSPGPWDRCACHEVEPLWLVDGDCWPRRLHQVLAVQHEQCEDVPGTQGTHQGYQVGMRLLQPVRPFIVCIETKYWYPIILSSTGQTHLFVVKLLSGSAHLLWTWNIYLSKETFKPFQLNDIFENGYRYKHDWLRIIKCLIRYHLGCKPSTT